MSVPSPQSAPRPQQRSFWIAVICGAVILTIGIGALIGGLFVSIVRALLSVNELVLG